MNANFFQTKTKKKPHTHLASLIIFLILVILFSSNNLVRCQNLHQWGSISQFHGLPSDNVRVVAQDKDAILWFGTDNGLVKFDGRRVQSAITEGFANVKITALKSDADGVLWIGTDTGAYFYENRRFQPISETSGQTIVSIFNAPGRAYLVDSKGEIFECARRGEQNELRVTQLPYSDKQLAEPVETAAFLKTADKTLLGTKGRGLLEIENDTAREINSRPRPFFINVLASDKSGNLFVGANAKETESGLFVAQNLLNPMNIGENLGNVTAIVTTESGENWVGTEKRGVYRLKNSQIIENYTFENTFGGLRSNRIYSILVDRESVVWFGTDRGVCRYDARSPFNQTISEDSNTNFIRAIFQAKSGEIFVGTNRGLFIADSSLSTLSSVKGLEGKPIYAISEDASGQILIGTANGLFSYPNESALLPDNTRAIQNFRNSTFLSLYGRGLVQFESGKTTADFSSNENLREIISLHNVGNEKMWIGTAKNGVFFFDGSSFSTDNRLDNLRGKVIRDIKSSPKLGVWLATENGLFQWQNQELKEIIPNLEFRQIYLDETKGEVWCASAKDGLYHLKFDADLGWLQTDLNVEQGLPSPNIFALVRPTNTENTLFIGTNRGFSHYSPNQIQPSLIFSRVLSQRLHDPSEFSGKIVLDYPQNTLALEVTALSSRTFPEQFQYAFTLKDSFGRTVSKKLSNDAQFLMENLAPDIYSVEVFALNQDLQKSTPLKLDFQISKAPFPWTSATLALLLGLTLIALFLAFKERRQLFFANRELANARFELANEAERERRRIARDLHDQTLADLRNLMLQSDKISSENAASFRAEIEDISQEIRRICEDLSPSVLENVGLTAALEFLFANVCRPNNIENDFQCDTNLEDQIKLPSSQQMQIYRIVQEVLSNIVRHSGANKVTMSLSKNEADNFVIKIEDNGREFSPESQTNQGRGLTNIKSRAELIEAEIFWGKNQNGENLFHLTKSLS
jgi:signal transduction histidine kinase/ligand-binding sensor domain-containing protein